MTNVYEVNFDGLVGPTHNYSGLSPGNIASIVHSNLSSNPKKAALQGLEKMRSLHELGLKQAILPPYSRPNLSFLNLLGFEKIVPELKNHPEITSMAFSASSMWTANAATITPSSDSLDNKLHITPANLAYNMHRSLEPVETYEILKKIFTSKKYFTLHPPLPYHSCFADEGAANHTRFCNTYGDKGVHLYVYGKNSFIDEEELPIHFPARQALQASEANRRNHNVPKNQVVFAKQNPKAIDAGVFHNDVISTGNCNVFLCHEEAFINTEETIKLLEKAYLNISKSPLSTVLVSSKKVSLKDAVSSYLFNSQIINNKSKQYMELLCPSECEKNPSVQSFIENDLIPSSNNPIGGVRYFNLRQSMRNGGGPACLRLRIVMTEEELQNINQGVIFTPKLYQELKRYIEKQYPETLKPSELLDQSLVESALQIHVDIMNMLSLI